MSVLKFGHSVSFKVRSWGLKPVIHIGHAIDGSVCAARRLCQNASFCLSYISFMRSAVRSCLSCTKLISVRDGN